MVQISAAVIAAAIAAPVFAAPFGSRAGHFDHLRNQKVEAREPKFSISKAHLKTAGIIAKAAGKAAKSGVELAAAVGSDLPQSREYGDLEDKEKSHIHRQAAGHVPKPVIARFSAATILSAIHNQAKPAQICGYVDELDSRDPKNINQMFSNGGGNLAGRIAGFMHKHPPREYADELAARDSKNQASSVAGGVRHPTPLEHVDELGARAPNKINQKFTNGARNLAGTIVGKIHFHPPREFDDVAEVLVREYYIRDAAEYDELE